MPETLLKKLTRLAFIAIIGLTPMVVSSDRVDAGLVRCEGKSNTIKCCEEQAAVEFGVCKIKLGKKIIDEAEYTKCVNDMLGAQSTCKRGVLTSTPSMGNEPLKIAPSSPTLMKPTLIPQNKLQQR